MGLSQLDELVKGWRALNFEICGNQGHGEEFLQKCADELDAVIALMRGQAEPRGWISDNDLLKLRESVDDARNIRMSTKRTHLRVHPVHIPALATMKQEPADEQ